MNHIYYYIYIYLFYRTESMFILSRCSEVQYSHFSES